MLLAWYPSTLEVQAGDHEFQANQGYIREFYFKEQTSLSQPHHSKPNPKAHTETFCYANNS